MISRKFTDFVYFVSLLGIYPRFIEPRWLKTTNCPLPAPFPPFSLVQLTDLHLHPALSNRYLNKIIEKVRQLRPDLIVFTGDFLCRSTLHCKKRLLDFLNAFEAPLGCFAVLGNHDYADWVTINTVGEYAVDKGEGEEAVRGFRRLFKQQPLKRVRTEEALSVPLHQELMEVLEASPFTLLHNETVTLPLCNLTGVGEYMTGHFCPKKAFEGYDPSLPGIVLSHNPDGIPHLAGYPGDLILSGHTHGGQINLPFLWKKFTLLENPRFKRGWLLEGNKAVYINRGLGSGAPLRFGSRPEILYLSRGPK